jgi:hypothetical protein
LDRRIADLPGVRREVASWEQRRNDAKATIDWRFTNDVARGKLERLYPA